MKPQKAKTCKRSRIPPAQGGVDVSCSGGLEKSYGAGPREFREVGLHTNLDSKE